MNPDSYGYLFFPEGGGGWRKTFKVTSPGENCYPENSVLPPAQDLLRNWIFKGPSKQTKSKQGKASHWMRMIEKRMSRIDFLRVTVLICVLVYSNPSGGLIIMGLKRWNVAGSDTRVPYVPVFRCHYKQVLLSYSKRQGADLIRCLF